MDPELLAQQLGYADSDPAAAPAYAQPVPSPIDDGGRTFTDDDLYAAYGIAPDPTHELQSTQPTAPRSPSPVAPTPVPVAAAPTAVSGSVSASGKGFSGAKHAQLSSAKGPEGDYRRGQAKIEQEGTDQYNQLAGLFGTANENARAAQEEVTREEVEYAHEQAGQDAWLAGKMREYATAEQEAHAKSAATIAQSRADYVAALNDLRASGISTSLFDGMTGGQKVGTLASVFVHDFLGVKGMKTSAMDTINKAIDSHIHAQEVALRTKGEVAQGFKQVWDMQRAEASSDEEARARVKGMMFEGFKQEVMAHMGQFSSGLMFARGQAALAKLDAEQAKNMFEVWKHIDTSTNAKLQQELSWQLGKMQNAQQAWSNSIAARREAREEKALAAKAREKLLADLVPDVSKSGGGAMRWEFREGISEEEKREANKKMIGAAAMTENIEEYRSMLREYDSIKDPTTKKTFADTNSRKMVELQRKILSDEILRTSGKAATEAEAARIESRVPLNTAWTNADVETVVAGFEKHGIQDTQKVVSYYMRDLAENDPRRGLKGAQGQFARGELVDATATHNAAGKGLEKTTVDVATEALTVPDSGGPSNKDLVDRAYEAGVTPNGEWSKYVQTNPEIQSRAKAAQTYLGTGEGQQNLPRKSRSADPDFEQTNADATRDKTPPKWATGIMMLRAAAEKGDKRAIDQLNHWSGIGADNADNPYLPDGSDPNSAEGRAKREFAIYEYRLAHQAGVKGVE